MYYFIDVTDSFSGQVRRHIVTPRPNNEISVWPLTDDNPNKPAYDEWVAAGNTPEPWNPEQENN